jgi:hypothetical protein
MSENAVDALADEPRAFAGEQSEPDLAVQDAADTAKHYLLPRYWSLHYALTKKQWSGLRQRVKQRDPQWEHCSCPNRCKANDLDEVWTYDHGSHTKIFRSAKFICRGCHWLKTLPWRIDTWLRSQGGLLAPGTSPPHIIACLGWTQARVDALRATDLRRDQVEKGRLAGLLQQVRQRRAAILPTPLERLSSQQLSEAVKAGQTMIVPWRVDLSALAAYAYGQEEIAQFEERMYHFAAKGMGTRSESLRGLALKTPERATSFQKKDVPTG